MNERVEQPLGLGAWETAVVFSGDVPQHHRANETFLNLIRASNPSYTGWPVWLDSRAFADVTSRPYVLEGAWQALIGSSANSVDEFWRIDPRGRFYLYRTLEDDLAESSRSPEPGTVLDFAIVVLRTTEAIAVAAEFAKQMGCTLETTTLAFSFRWLGLKGRELYCWIYPGRFIPPGYVCYHDEVTSDVAVPLETPTSATARYVQEATAPLFAEFNGFELPYSVTEDLTTRLLERRL